MDGLCRSYEELPFFGLVNPAFPDLLRDFPGFEASIYIASCETVRPNRANAVARLLFAMEERTTPFTAASKRKGYGNLHVVTRPGDADRVLEKFFEIGGVGNAILSFPECRFLKVNQQLCELTGLAEKELLERTCSGLTHPDDRERDSLAWQETMAEGRLHHTIEKRYVRPNGDIVWVQITATPVIDESGKYNRAIAVIRDVTDHHEAIRGLDQSHAELEQRVAERTRELAASNRKLTAEMRAKRLLENAILEAGERESRRIGQELHDHLCQQLLGITFATKVCARELEKADPIHGVKLHELAQMLNDAVKSCRELVRGLNFFNPDDLISAIHSLADHASRSIPCQAECPVEVSLSNVEAARHAYRIAQEAVANALKHSHASQIVITLKETSKKMTIRIQDDGRGFSPAEQANAMGLQGMKFRAGAINGNLKIDSQLNRGTRVTCTFPLTS